MGPRHSKRSLDMAGTPTKSEIEGVGNTGKLEKIVDGIVEKVAANGHVDGELQNGSELHQSSLEPVQNGEAAAVAMDHSMEQVILDEKGKTETVALTNGEMEEKVNGETEEKTAETEGKEDKKEKKKEKKEKVVKKKFSLRSFSFSKKDKSKPKEDKVPDAKKNGIEESQESPEAEETTVGKVDESKEIVVESEVTSPETPSEATAEEPKQEVAVGAAAAVPPILVMNVEATPAEVPPAQPVDIIKPVEKEATTEDLPPPLPASPPPTEPKEEIEPKESEPALPEEQSFPAAVEDVKETIKEVLFTAKEIEKEVEQAVEESVRNATQETAQCDQVNEDVGGIVSSASDDVLDVKADASVTVLDKFSNPEEPIANVVTLSSTAEEMPEKDEFGAGESLAEMDSGTETVIAANSEVVVAE